MLNTLNKSGKLSQTEQEQETKIQADKEQSTLLSLYPLLMPSISRSQKKTLFSSQIENTILSSINN